MSDLLTPKPADATVGHNSAAVGEMIAADPLVVFREPDLVPALIDEIRAMIAAHTPNVKSASGRTAIASLAAKIVKTKTRLDAAGKELNEDHRAAINKVDAVRKTIRDQLDDLRDEARAPLTQWEAAEEARERHIGDVLRQLNEAARPPAGASADTLAKALEFVRSVEIDEASFGARTDETLALRDRIAATLSAAHDGALRAEEAQAELARIKAEQAERERAQAEAEAKAKAKAEADRRAEAERARIENERAAAEARAAEAAREAERREAQKRIDAAEAEKRAAVAAAEAGRKAAADALAAKEKQEAEARRKAAAEAAEAKRREADQAHRDGMIVAAVEALTRHTTLTGNQARSAVLAIAAGQIPAIKITF